MEDNETTDLVVGGMIEANGGGLVFRRMDDMFRFAKYVQVSGLAPKSFDTPEKILVAMQAGAELGMKPMRALQSIAVINGRPSLWGDAALGLVKASGLCEYVKERIVDEKGDKVAYCVSKRKDEADELETRFSTDDAKTADLWGKSGTWTTYPERMLKYRARGFNLRDNFPDVLCGFHIAEEMMDTPPEQAYQPETPTRAERKKITSVDIKEQIKDCVNLFEKSMSIELSPGNLIHFFCEFAAMQFGGAAGDYQDNKGMLDEIKLDAEKITELNRILETGIPDEIINMMPKPPENSEQIAEDFENEVIKDKHICRNPKCGITFDKPNENGLCPKCLTDKIEEIKDAND